MAGIGIMGRTVVEQTFLKRNERMTRKRKDKNHFILALWDDIVSHCWLQWITYSGNLSVCLVNHTCHQRAAPLERIGSEMFLTGS